MSTEPPLGEPVAFVASRPPAPITHSGARVVLRALDPGADAAALYALTHAPHGDPSIWAYLLDGPFPELASYRAQLDAQAGSSDPLFFTITAGTDHGLGAGVSPGDPLGIIAYLAIVPEHGRIELGHIWFGPPLQRTAAATEAIFLLAAHAFDDLGFRRVEWKCNALNAPSRAAALRYGFVYEGTFAEHMVVKGRNRDTAWFSITDKRWPAIRTAFETWLAPDNFDANGEQKRSLRELTSG